MDFFHTLHWTLRTALILIGAAGCHIVIRSLHGVIMKITTASGSDRKKTREIFWKSHPKIATVTSLTGSAVTFAVYFFAVGFALKEFNISLTAYFATASVIGLAVAFGTQGLVQDVVIGLTLVFTDVFDVGDVIEVSGQIGKVERIGLRFTIITNMAQQRVYIPNRNIAVVGRYKKGHVRAYADIQIPDEMEEKQLIKIAEKTAQGMYEQFLAIIPEPPETFGVYTASGGAWKYLRIRFRIWPGQNSLLETVFRQRLTAELKRSTPGYSDWMITITYRAQ